MGGAVISIAFDNSYARLPARFHASVLPAVPPAPRLLALNAALAAELGLDADWLSGPEGLGMLSGRTLAAGSEPIALAYAGHQFGHFVPQLGDGRAVLLGEVIDRGGRRRDIQLKGSGRTPFSRGGDGRAALGPVLREYVVSEAMAALGIPTTRALSAMTTGEDVRREAILPGAVLARVAASHVRVGTFQYFAARRDEEALRLLVGHVVARHYPHAEQAACPALAMLEAVAAAQADLVARWLLVGFVHGVMNTDNMSVAGETIDYGPCAFLDAYDPAMVFSSIDQFGRYAFSAQPGAALWNLTRLAEALLPLLDPDADRAVELAQEALQVFRPRFEATYHQGMMRKFGIAAPCDDDADLAAGFLKAMAANRVDFTLFFRRLCDLGQGGEKGEANAAAAAGSADEPIRSLFVDPTACDPLLDRLRRRYREDGLSAAARRAMMRGANPAFIPRNHRVEAMIAAALTGDMAPFEELTRVLADPYEDQPGFARYADPPALEERVLQTFCGT